MRAATANLPLPCGKAPRLLFNRMTRLAGELAMVIVEEFSTEESYAVCLIRIPLIEPMFTALSPPWRMHCSEPNWETGKNWLPCGGLRLGGR